MQHPKLIVGISGATGIIYDVRLLQVARELAIETHLVVTKAGKRTLAYETDLTLQVCIVAPGLDSGIGGPMSGVPSDKTVILGKDRHDLSIGGLLCDPL